LDEHCANNCYKNDRNFSKISNIQTCEIIQTNALESNLIFFSMITLTLELCLLTRVLAIFIEIRNNQLK